MIVSRRDEGNGVNSVAVRGASSNRWIYSTKKSRRISRIPVLESYLEGTVHPFKTNERPRVSLEAWGSSRKDDGVDANPPPVCVAMKPQLLVEYFRP
jgi:hypothetical protein